MYHHTYYATYPEMVAQASNDDLCRRYLIAEILATMEGSLDVRR